ncbi:MAG: dihydrolipoamide acetyltransferase family protein, partial [Chloroflexi bacterium]|nr:dihydrolipoamide acetyltransferase family protein [Chloroflexota bacterium]
KKVGDPVSKGDQLVEIESSKVNAEVEATAHGTLGRIIVQEGTTVNIGTVLGLLLAEGETAADLPAETAPAPAASRPGAPAASSARPVAGASRTGGNAVVTPRARKLAKDLGVDVENITGTGPSGRITEDDVRKAAEGGGQAAAPAPASTVPVREVIPLTGMRGTIARRMSASAQVPTVTLNTHADVTPAIELQRELLKAWRTERIRPQYQDLVLAAVARALTETPQANAHLVGNEIRVLDEVNLGVAVALPEGLVVPVIHNAGKKSALEIAKEVRDLAKAAKDGSITIDQMTGSTFSITNLGAYDIEAFDPLLNPPEIGILGLGRVEERTAVIDGQIVIRSIGHLSLTFDHRAWDGAPAAEFLRTIVRHLKEPSWMLG